MTSKDSDHPAHTRSLIRAFGGLFNFQSVKLLIEWHLEFLSFKGGYIGLNGVYTSQNATVLEITCRGSIIFFSLQVSIDPVYIKHCNCRDQKDNINEVIAVAVDSEGASTECKFEVKVKGNIYMIKA